MKEKVKVMKKENNNKGVILSPQIVVQYLSNITSTYPSLWNKQDLHNTRQKKTSNTEYCITSHYQQISNYNYKPVLLIPYNILEYCY